MEIRRIVVFCGSSLGNDNDFIAETHALGEILVQQNIGLVYGGAKVGLMGVIADSVLQSGGEVIGVIPEFLSAKEIIHDGLSELHIVNSMHERKTLMHELSDGVIALPGGFGTLEELFEMLTWGQLGLHTKPIGILNLNSFYSHLIQMLDHMEKCELLKTVHRNMVLTDRFPESLVDKMIRYQAPIQPKWISPSKT